MTLLAQVPLFWHMPPLVFAVSLVYSATRFESPRLIAIHAARWAAYILLFLASTNVFLYLIALDLDPYWHIPIFAAAVLLLLAGGRTGKQNRRRSHASVDRPPT